LIGTLAMICIFHIIGSAAMGATVRGWMRRGFSCNSLFMIVWGAMFGIAPLAIGYNLFVQHGAPYMFGIEIGVLIGAFLFVALVPDWFKESFDAQTIAPIAFGGVFLLVGIGAGAAAFSEAPLMAVLMGGLFAAVGGLVFVWGLIRALKA
jgi:hypothetical protein